MEATGVPARGWDEPTEPYYDGNGNYALATVGHMIYEFTAEDVMLAGQTPLYTSSEYNKYDILARLPRGCTHFLVLDPDMYEGHWYVIGKSHATGEWCNLDSMLNSKGRGYHPILLDEDWARIKGKQGATLLCLVRKDAYSNNGTIRCARNSQRGPSDLRSAWEMPYVDGRTVVVYTRQVRSAQQMYDTNNPFVRDTANTPTIPPLTSPQTTNTDTEEAEMVEQAATALVIAHAQGLDPDGVDPAAHRAAEAAQRAAAVAKHPTKVEQQQRAALKVKCGAKHTENIGLEQQRQPKACETKTKPTPAPPASQAAAHKRPTGPGQSEPVQKKVRGVAHAAPLAPAPQAKSTTVPQRQGQTAQHKQPKTKAVQQSITAFLSASGKTAADDLSNLQACTTQATETEQPQPATTTAAVDKPQKLSKSAPEQQHHSNEEMQSGQAPPPAAATNREQHTTAG
jgi:hypothetical protein